MRKRKIRGQRKIDCSKCGGIIEKHRRKHSRYCRECANACMRTNRKKHSELSDDERKKANARSYLNVYIRRGKIKREPCIICGNPKTQGHHHDYDKPLEVIWYCKEHHLEYHKNIIQNL